MSCDVNSKISQVLCTEWKLNEFCDSAKFPKTHTFDVQVPKSKMDLFNSTLVFRIDKIFGEHGTSINSACPTGKSISTSCSIDCNDYYVNDLIAKPSISNDNVYDIYEFWTFLTLMMCAWVGQAVAVSIGDAICFELLGKYHRFSFQLQTGRIWKRKALSSKYLC